MNPDTRETIAAAHAAAHAAAIAAADSAGHAAAFHASWRRHVAGLLAVSVLPAAATLVFARDEDTLTAGTQITLLAARDSGGALLWYNDCTRFDGHPDTEALGDPPLLDADTLSSIEYQLMSAYDAAGGGFDTTDDGASVMPAANLLLLPVPSPAPGLPHPARGRTTAGETTAAVVRENMREAAAAYLDTDLADGGLADCAYTLAAGFRDLDTGTVTTADDLPAFTDDAFGLDALDRFQADEPDDDTKRDPELLCVRCAAVLRDIEPGTTLGLLVQTALEHECLRHSAGRA